MTDVTSPVPQFVHCNVTAIEPDIEMRQKNRQFKLFFTLIKLSIQPSIRLPFYLQGAQIHIQDQILYWISPGKGRRLSLESLGTINCYKNAYFSFKRTSLAIWKFDEHFSNKNRIGL